MTVAIARTRRMRGRQQQNPSLQRTPLATAGSSVVVTKEGSSYRIQINWSFQQWSAFHTNQHMDSAVTWYCECTRSCPVFSYTSISSNASRNRSSIVVGVVSTIDTSA